MKRLTIWTVLGTFLLCAATTAFADPTGPEKGGLTKDELANSYKPAIVNGMPWYRGAKAVTLHNERRGTKARPILFLRILGDFDAGT